MRQVGTRLEPQTIAEIEAACLAYNESKANMLRCLIIRGLHEYRAARKRDPESTNIFQLLELKQASTQSSRDC